MKKYRIMIICIVIFIACLVFGQPPIQPILDLFLDLEDTPSDYSGQDGKYVKVDETNNQLIFETPAGSGDMTKAVYDTDANDVVELAEGLHISGQAAGDVIYFNGSNWVRLAKGTAGQVLEMNAGATAPEWDTDDTGAAGEDSIGATELKDTDAPADEDIYTYESTGSTGEWHTIAQMLALTDTDSLPEGSSNLYANTEEEIEDFIGGMLGGTETYISVTYQDETNDIDFVVSPSGIAGAIGTGEYADNSVNNADINWDNIPFLSVNGAAIGEPFSSGWNADFGPAQKDNIYDYLHNFDADDDGSFTDETWYINIDAATGDSATAFFDAGTIEHERGGLEADINDYTGLVAITGGATAEVDSKSELEGHIADVADFAEADGDTYSGVHDYGGATSLEMVNGANPTIDEAGEYGLDTTKAQLIIADDQGTARVYADVNNVKSITIADDGTWDNEAIPGPILSYDSSCTIYRILATVNGSSTPSLDYNFEERAWGSYASAGTDIYSSDQAADSNGEEESSFNNAGIAAKAKLYFTTGSSAETGTVDYITIEIVYRIDRQ